MGLVTLLAYMLGGPAAGQMAQQWSNQREASATPEQPLTPAENLLPQLPGPQDAEMGLSQAQAPQLVDTGLTFNDMSAPFSMDEPPPMPEQQEAFNSPYTPFDNPVVEEPTGDDVTVEGDPWQPKKQDVLSIIGDFLLMRRGMQPLFRQRLEERNLREAMKGYDRDPEAAIRRVNQVDAEKAVSLRSRLYEDRYRQEQAREKRFQAEQELDQTVSSMLDPLLKRKPEEAAQMYPKFRDIMARRIEMRGGDPAALPEQWDPDEMEIVRSMGYTPYQQSQRDRLQQATDALIENRKDRLAETRRNNEARLRETRRNNDADNARADEKLEFDQAQAREKNAPFVSVFNKDTGGFRGKLAPDGRGLAIFNSQTGKWEAYRLRTPRDLTTRVRSPGEDRQLNQAYGIDIEEEE